jgi:hypothetical protein
VIKILSIYKVLRQPLRFDGKSASNLACGTCSISRCNSDRGSGREIDRFAQVEPRAGEAELLAFVPAEGVPECDAMRLAATAAAVAAGKNPLDIEYISL